MNDGRGFVVQATFAQRLKQLMELRGAKQADVIRMAQTRGKHLGKSQVSQYVSGKTIPRRDVMDVLARGGCGMARHGRRTGPRYRTS